MSKNIENHDSVLLLQDCIAGCKMALESMDDIREHTDDKQLRELMTSTMMSTPGCQWIAGICLTKQVQILRNRVCLQRWLRSCRLQ